MREFPRVLVLATLAAHIRAQDPGPSDVAAIPPELRQSYDALRKRLHELTPGVQALPYPGRLPSPILEVVERQVTAVSERLRERAPRSALHLVEDWFHCMTGNGFESQRVLPCLDRMRELSVDHCSCWRLREINQTRRRVLKDLGRHQDAIAAVKDTVERSLEAQTIERPYLRIWLHMDLARELLFEVHQPLEAARYIDGALSAVEEFPVPWDAQIVARLRENPNIWITERSRPRAATYEDTKGQALLLRGIIRAHLGAAQDAICDYERAEGLLRVSGNLHRRLNCRHNMADALYELGRLKEADALARSVHEDYGLLVFEDGKKDRGGQAQMNKVLGHIARAEGRWSDACDLYDSCFEEFAGVSRARFLEKPIHVHYHAMESLLFGAECRIRLGSLEAARRDLTLVSDYFSHEENKTRVAEAQRIRAVLALAEGNLTAGLSALDEAKATFRIHGQLPQLTMCALTEGHILKRKSDFRGALRSFSESAAFLLQGMNEQTISQNEDASHAYRMLYRPAMDGILECLVEIGNRTTKDVDDAYRAVQVFHGFGLVGVLTAHNPRAWLERLPEREGETYRRTVRERDNAFRRWRATAASQPVSLAAMWERETEMERLELRLRELEASIRVLESAARTRGTDRGSAESPLPSNLTDVAATLGKNSVLLEFVAGERKLYAFVFRSGKPPAFVPLADVATIGDVVGRFHQRGATEQPLERAAQRLSKAILAPLAPVLAPLKPGGTLLISPAGELCAVPFAALAVPDHGRRLVEDWDIAYVHSGTVYRELIERQRRTPPVTKHRLVGFGDPVYDNRSTHADTLRGSVDIGKLRRLRATGRELREIARILKDSEGESELFLRAQATERNLRRPGLRDATIVHIACHGIANRRVPSLSLLALSREGEGGTDATDGLVLMRELRGLQLSPELLTLSACETNVGELLDLEGALGLTRAAIAGGARSVLSTLWWIPDEASTRLVVQFYENWISRGMTRPRALAQAQRNAIASGAPTGSWAAFTLWDTDR